MQARAASWDKGIIMFRHIHVCKTQDEAQSVIDTEKLRLGDRMKKAAILNVPDLKIFDHADDFENPTMTNQSKHCAYIEWE